MEYCKFHFSMFISTFSYYFNNLGLPISACYRAMFKNKQKPEWVPCHFCSLVPIQAADPGQLEVAEVGVCISCFSPVAAAAGQAEGTSRASAFSSSPGASHVDSCPVLPQSLRDLSPEASPCSSGSVEASKCTLRSLQLEVCDGGYDCYVIHLNQNVSDYLFLSSLFHKMIQNCYDLLVRKKRLIVLFSHWLLHAYGIISISRADKLEQDLPLLALVPTPALFYLFTAKFTEPSRVLSEGANGH